MLAGGLGARVGRASGLLGHAGARRLDHPHLALGALRDVADRVGDLADGAAGLLGGRGHLLRGGGHAAGAAGDLAHHVAELGAHVVVALQAAVDLGQHRVEGLGQDADLVGPVVLDRLGALRDRDPQIALGDGAEAVGERGQVVLVEAAEAGDELVDAALDAARDQVRDRRARPAGRAMMAMSVIVRASWKSRVICSSSLSDSVSCTFESEARSRSTSS